MDLKLENLLLTLCHSEVLLVDCSNANNLSGLGHELRYFFARVLSTTAFLESGYGKFDARRYVDSENMNFMVVQGNVRMSIPPKFMGCRAMITDKKTGKTLESVCADVGPSNHLGEASIAAVKFFGLNSNPKSGGSSDRSRWHYRCWPERRRKDSYSSKCLLVTYTTSVCICGE